MTHSSTRQPRGTRVLNSLALAACMALSMQAHALSLGRLQVLSAMGEPLRAEVTLQDFNPAEALGLQLKALPAIAYSALGQQNNALAADFEITLLQTAEGAKLMLSSRRIIDAAFVDFVLEARWPAGRSVREYTALFEEKSTAASPPTLIRPQVEAASSKPAPSAATSAPPSAPDTAASAPASPSNSSDAARVPARANADVVVQRGQTAAAIAQKALSPGVTLDQMLLALVRDNPDAFVDSNVNRLRAGSALRLPDTASAQQTAAHEARELIALQYQDFVAWRERLAQATPKRDLPEADRQHSGTVKQAAAPEKSGDKLTLSKPAVDARSAEQVAKELQTRDLQTRNRDLAQQLDALDQLGTKARAATEAAPTEAQAKASDTSEPDKPQAQRDGTSPDTSGTLPAPPLPTQDASSPSALLESLIASPVMPAAAGGLVAAMAALALWRVRQRRKQETDTSAGQTAEHNAISEPAANAEQTVDATPWQPPQPSEDDTQNMAGAALSPAEIMSRLPDLDLPRLDNDALLQAQATDASAPAFEPAPASEDIPALTNAHLETQLDTQLDTDNAPPNTAHQPLSLDLGGLSLDLDVPAAGDAATSPTWADTDASSLASKLVLAREFVAMGDKEGARALVDEILAQGDADLRAAAQALLPELT